MEILVFNLLIMRLRKILVWGRILCLMWFGIVMDWKELKSSYGLLLISLFSLMLFNFIDIWLNRIFVLAVMRIFFKLFYMLWGIVQHLVISGIRWFFWRIGLCFLLQHCIVGFIQICKITIYIMDMIGQLFLVLHFIFYGSCKTKKFFRGPPLHLRSCSNIFGYSSIGTRFQFLCWATLLCSQVCNWHTFVGLHFLILRWKLIAIVQFDSRRMLLVVGLSVTLLVI